MAGSLATKDWLKCLNTAYLTTFIARGGAAVKFGVPLDDGNRNGLCAGLVQAAKDANFVSAFLSASSTRLHAIEHIWFEVARQLPFEALAADMLGSMAREEQWSLPSTWDERALAVQLGETNGLDVNYVQMVLERRLQTRVLRDKKLAKEFRIAMTWLCRARLTGGEAGTATVKAIRSWLTGEVRAVAPVKPYSIFCAINRTNARFFLESTFAWVRGTGRPGTMLVLDVAQFTIKSSSGNSSVCYNRSTLLDAYEVLRQFIDGLDHMEGILMVVVAAPEFLNTDATGRGVGAYQAIRYRVHDEVRDRNLANPMATLVRIDENAA